MANEPLFGGQFGAVDAELILRSLISVVSTPDAVRGLRLRPITYGQSVVAVKAVTCASKEDFEINIRRSLYIHCDNHIALNVFVRSVNCSEPIGTPIPCSHAAGLYELANHLFVEITHVGGAKEYALAVLLIADENGE